MRLRRLLLITCVCATAFLPPDVSWAQDSVNVRTGTHTDYSRLVFDWTVPVPYTVSKTGTDTVDIVFQKAASMNANGVNSATAPGIRSVEKLSAEGENLKVRVRIPDGADYRHFLVGDRVVLDVFGKTGAVAAAVPKPEAAKPETVKPEPVKETPKPVDKIPAPVAQVRPADGDGKGGFATFLLGIAEHFPQALTHHVARQR